MIRKYVVQWRYSSSYGGPWVKGQEVELDEQRAEIINRDSPGVLVEKKAEPARQEPNPDLLATRQLDAPAHDRQAKRAQHKR